MVRDIDDLADERARGIQSPGEEYYDKFLLKRPKTEWSPYIDETAKDLSAGIQISDLSLSKDNFGREIGSYYRRGLKKTAGQYADLPTVLEKKVSDQKLGLLAYQLNELSYDITTTDLGINDVEKATEAVIEKLLTRHVGSDLNFSFEMTGVTVADIATQLFKNETIASNVDVLLNEFQKSASQGLLSLMDEPQMMTPLWDHQREALIQWTKHDHRGYVDMATATGKTVLGLGALALQYGELHPNDQDIEDVRTRGNSEGSDDVLIVAHSGLILEQWRREFDRHLNIPQERTTGSDDITLKWGTVHFRTPQALVNEDRLSYDLVLLDEAHHYATGSEWGTLLDEFDGNVLAMSGSVDDAGSDSERIEKRLSNSIGSRCKRYTITKAREHGIIPSFDWEVHYAPYDVVGDDFQKVTKRSEQAFTDFRQKRDGGEITLDPDRHLRTYEDIRRFSHTTQGNKSKQENEEFRDLVTRLFSRRTKRWNLSPVLGSVVDLVIEHSTTEKVVVLADSNAQVEELESRLQDIVADSTQIYLVSQSQSQTEQRDTIDDFDEPESAGILLGTGDLLGEGVNMNHASVAINMATGGVNPELVQRIGRVLRNPTDTPKHAMFYNVVGIPPSIESAVPREDGKRIIEQAAQFCSLGGRFEKLPGFSTVDTADIDALGTMLQEGAAFIDMLDTEGVYDWGIDTVKGDDLKALQSAAYSGDGDAEAILGQWEEYAWEHSKDDLEPDPTTDDPSKDSSDEGDVTDEMDGLSQDTVSEDVYEIPQIKQERIADLVRLQPTKNSELQNGWGLSSGSEVHNYLQSELTDYYFRDSDNLIWASDEAEALVNGTPPNSEGADASQLDPDIDTQSDLEPSDGDLLDEIRHLKESLGQVPSKAEMMNRGEYSISQYKEAFDTWSNAVRGAGFEPRGSQKRGYTRDEVIKGLREVASELGKPPSVSDINHHAAFSASVVYNYFDSLSDAQKAADTHDESDSTPEQESEQQSAESEQTDVDPATNAGNVEGRSDRESTDSGTTSGEMQSTKEQTIFWDRDVEQITEYGEDEAEELESDDETTSKRDPLDKKIDEWKSQLLDLTRRNKLIAFKPTKTKSLPFEETDPTIIASELDQGAEIYIRKHPDEEDEGTTVRVDDIAELDRNELLPTRVVDEAENSLYQIGLKNKQYLRERGVDTLYLSLGMLRWYSVDYSDEANRSPLFLAPVELEEDTQKDEDRHDYVLKPKAEGLRLNPALRKKLAVERGISLPADNALSLKQIDAAFESVYSTLRGFNRWTIQKEVVLGIFDFTKFSLYSDLERNRSAIKRNPIIRALNGDMERVQEAEGDIETPSAEELDQVVDPIEMYQVLDADSSQQEAIEAAKRGKSFVLQGPPGTGKSQTIANIIAEKLADGERVLFVSEKQAALNVVKNRLDDIGIGRFCLEVHSEKANNADVLSSLEDELKAGRVKSAEKRVQRLQKLRDRRDTINKYGNHLFYSPDGWDLTAYQAFGIVSDHMDVPRIDVGIDNPLDIEESVVDSAVDEIETLARFEKEIDAFDTSPWRHTSLTQWGVDTADSMRHSLAQQLDALGEIIETTDTLDTKLGIRPQSLSEFRDVESLLQHLLDQPTITWQESFFDESFTQENSRLDELAELEQERDKLIDGLSENYQRSFFSANGAELNNELAGYGLLKILKPSYRSLKRQITHHAQEGYDPGHEQLLEDTRKLAELQRIEDRRDDYQGVIQRLGPLYEGGDTDWETLAQAQSWMAKLNDFDQSYTEPVTEALIDGSLPEIEPLAEQTQEVLKRYDSAASFFENAMAVDEMTVEGQPLRQAPLTAVVSELERLRSGVPNLQRRVQFASQLADIRESICGDYVDRFLRSDHDADQLVPAFEKRFYTKWLNSVYEHTDLGSFNADEMERYVGEFRRLDEEQQELAKVEIQHKVTRRRPSLSLEHASSSEQVLVRRETEKQRRHKPLRKLFDEAGSFITQLTPCFMMSPLSVAQYLKAESIQFDTVVFDEASQIMPQDAISSLIRADQAIIAGDTKQLPPTSFFQADVETTEDVREDLDSILEETASVLSEKDLRWHYRSRTKELIEFSNYHYYNNGLRTFPENEPDVETGVSFEYVSDGVYDRGGSRQNEIEAQRVIDLIEEHAENHSDKSLGVVAFSSAQEQAIRDTLEERREENSVLDAFVSQDDVLDEFFIKNLEMVQGDERDRMIFSVGYGPDQDGTISMNFGPLNKSGGERRLNVAVTRAKEKITVASSIQPGEIDLTRTNSTGVEHFRNYLEYAKKGEQALSRDDTVTNTLDFDSKFEEAVYTALKDEGYDVVSQVQSSSYSIDLAIQYPDKPGKLVLGIECDGAAYHSSKTARDRDRTRQMVLESLGWTIHRIWSPDWTSNREREIQKINKKVNSLVSGESVSSQPDEIPSYEPEVIEVDSKTEHEEITEYQEPSLEREERYDPDKQGMDQANRNSILDTVIRNGPIEYDTAMRTYLDVWAQSRAGKKVQRIFRNRLDELKERNEVYEQGEFLWPPRLGLNFLVRVNTESDSRPIDEIPMEEIAKGIVIILQEGGEMEGDDVVLETTRLFGYQRRGGRIKDRIRDGISLLQEEGLVKTGNKVSLDSTKDPQSAILSRVYPSVSASSSGANSTGTRATKEGNQSRITDDSFPFLDFERSQWNVPCPYCDSKVNNTREAFVTHWTESDQCSGPKSSPPSDIGQISQSEWDEIIAETNARTSEQVQGKQESLSSFNVGEHINQVDQQDLDFDISTPDGSYPWIRFPDQGWKVPCPYCDNKVFNSEGAFRDHWRDSPTCHSPAPSESHTNSAERDVSELARMEKLFTLFENHLNRNNPADHWINLTFENDGNRDTIYQYLNGAHNFTGLTSSQKDALEDAVNQYDFSVESEGDNYVTLSSGTLQPDIEARLCLHLLLSVYDVELKDIEQASEHGNGFEAW